MKTQLTALALILVVFNSHLALAANDEVTQSATEANESAPNEVISFRDQPSLKVQKKALPTPQKVSFEYIRQQVLSRGQSNTQTE